MTRYTDLRDAVTNKAKAIVKKVTNLKPQIATVLGASFNLGLSAEIDAAIKVILDDSFLKVIDRGVFALDRTIDKTSQELQDLVQKVFDNLSELESKLEKLIDKFFQNISNLIKDIKSNLIDPIVNAIFKLEEKIFEDINQVIDKVFNFFTGTIKEFQDDLLKIFNPLPNPLDPCRQKLGIPFTPSGQLTHFDLFNLFECRQLKRLDDGTTVVKNIQETYATLQLESFKMTCLGRGSPAFQELYMRKWLDYGQLFEMWQEFKDNMTPQQAYDEAIRSLNQARSEYQSKVADIDTAQTTANDAVNKANTAQSAANSAQATANSAQAIANGAIKNIDFFVVEAAIDTTVQSNDVVINFPDAVDAVVLQTIQNDGNQIIRAPISQLNPTSFKVHFDGVNANSHRWIPALRFLGIKIRR
jgi:hypothetical protein